ncbi:hypothetical protein [Luteococcus sp. H154]|uniref:hypothetical protein n=1 Tax=Luteococcus sp. H154 TaxID=3139403 RepID=UPI00313DBB97
MKNRINTLHILISTSQTLASAPFLNEITGEMNSLKNLPGDKRPEDRLLKVLYTTRFLDSSLAQVIQVRGWDSNGTCHSLGDYLKRLKRVSVLTEDQKNHYMQQVTNKRNVYMHRASATPSPTEAEAILSEMHSCITEVLNSHLVP